MNTVEVRNTVIGEGMPKICVPIVGVTKEAILEEAKAITRLPADVGESTGSRTCSTSQRWKM